MWGAAAHRGLASAFLGPPYVPHCKTGGEGVLRVQNVGGETGDPGRSRQRGNHGRVNPHPGFPQEATGEDGPQLVDVLYPLNHGIQPSKYKLHFYQFFHL